ncbi:hypothetical protein Pcinc_007295 [Petrolisthes cinctipes]|uniref:NADP-dependent oxidoreductase domain-containing protein n=1 Tax=Petrolisthes cinctipes TaxID=88211 RepID=A0AAE1KYQ2_PETCI|nr:hypothetical protein Pcinc_007295 [Petrolisthes cinctipes]
MDVVSSPITILSNRVTLENQETLIPLLGISTNAQDDKLVVHRELAKAVNREILMIDTTYSDFCENEVGRILNKCWRRGDARSEYFVITKLPMIGNRRDDVRRFLRKSLSNMRLDYVDAYVMEGPVGLVGKHDTDVRPRNQEGQPELDKDTFLEGIWKAMEEECLNAYCRMIGLCNFNLSQINRICQIARIPPAIVMMDINVYNQCEKERTFLKNRLITPVALYPLGNPLHTPSEQHPLLTEHEVVREVAEKHEVTTSTVLVKFLHQQKIVSIIQINAVPETNTIFETLNTFTLDE